MTAKHLADPSSAARVCQFSPCRRYRYTLWREWDMLNSTYLMVIGLNPSTADETQDDPTIRRCIDFAKRARRKGSSCKARRSPIATRSRRT